MDIFGANDTNKTATKMLYWQWKLETGSTQAEIDANDLLDSAWMGDEITLGIQATGQQVMENQADGQYAVTFDASGGTLQGYGNSSQMTKNVTYGETYGELPSPTRDGYKFLGWNGKNKINVDNGVNDCLIDNKDGTYTMWYNDLGRHANNQYVNITNGTVMTMSYDLLEYNGTYGSPLQIVGYKVNGGTFYFKLGARTTPDIDRLQIYQEGSQPVGTYTKFKNLQLEEGTVVTEYEPYYIKSSTIVTQNKNHTLTAIWEPKTGE